MFNAVIFDLDDTLYPEWQFYEGGFAAVAAELGRRGIGPETDLRQRMESLHLKGRDRVFDEIAREFCFSVQTVPELVRLFHDHFPRLRLPVEAAVLLKELRPRYRLGIVTDGHAVVQRRKIQALHVESMVDAIVFADDRGRAYWKPHPQPLWDCCRQLGIDPVNAVFIGDNPERDLLAAQNAGMSGVRLRQGYFRERPTPPEIRPFGEIEELREVRDILNLFA